MGIKEANIILDNQWNTYYAGQSVKGRIEYVFDSPKKVRGIHVKIKGEAHTEWSESKEETNSQGRPENSDTRFSGNEEYFQVSYYLLGSNNGNEIEIPAGKHEYEFNCTLPPVLPSSFEGQYGYVRYTIKVTLDRPWKFDQDTKIAFTVINALDLNSNPSYRQPIQIQMEKTFCCLCCISAPLDVDVVAPVSGYVPGQHIPVSVNVENKSNVQVHLVKVSLRKVATYRAMTPSSANRKTTDVVLTVQEGPCPAGENRKWEIKMEIPPIPPSNLVNCSIIDLDYDLKVEAVVSGIHVNLSDKKYITIGTVPLMDNKVQQPPREIETQENDNSAPVLPVGPSIDTMPSAPPGEGNAGWVVPPYQSLYPSLAKPVLKQGEFSARSIQDKGDSEHTRLPANVLFAPNYPTYSDLPPALPR